MKKPLFVAFLISMASSVLADNNTEVINEHIAYVKDKYKAESICYTPLRSFSNTIIHEMHVYSDEVRKLTIFSIVDGKKRTIHESVLPPMNELGEKAVCDYLGLH